MSKKVLRRLNKQFGEDIIATHDQFGDETALVTPASWKAVATFLRDDSKLQMNHFIDLTAVDYQDRREHRYEVVLHMRSMQFMHRVRLKAALHADGDDSPHIDSLVSVWRGADWFERECFDMFGIIFDGHPDLRRILMYEEFTGHPLRKDYPAQRTQPLIPYREGINNEKLPPFGLHEGMPFGRQTHDHRPGKRNLLGFDNE